MCVHCGGSGYIDLSRPCPNCCAYSGESKAEGPATKEPEQSPSLPPGSPSGVVEALRTLDEMGKRLLKVVESLQEQSMEAETDAGYCLNRIDGLVKFIRSLPQAPATPVNAVHEIRLAAKKTCILCAETLEALADRLEAGATAPGSQGMESPRKEAREWLDSCQTCKVVFPKGGYHNCPAVREVREGDNHE